MKRKNIYTSLILVLLSIGFCLSCADDIETPAIPTIEEGEGIFMCTPPELEVSLTKSSDKTIQKNITEQGVSVKISERPWVGTNIMDGGVQTKNTWDDIVWDKNYANIGVFTVKSSDILSYEGDGNPAHITAFPFGRYHSGTWSPYETPSGNDHGANPYNYHNANLKIDALERKSSNRFFDESGGEELNFYGYFPYQHQTAGILFSLPPTSICRVFQANLHEENLLRMPYVFAATQTKDNVRMHDVMYSVSEDAPGEDNRNRYGNRNKKRHGGDNTKNDNVHMRFVHSFCRLQFKISAGSYRSEKSDPIKLSSLSVIGSKVFVDGNLNLIDGIVTSGNASTIYRALDNDQETTVGEETYVNLREKDLTIPMIVQPTGEIETLNDFRIVCVVDGVEYSSPLSPGVELKSNNVYDVNLILSPETKVIVSNGGGSTIELYNTDEYESVTANDVINDIEERNATFAKWMVIEPNTGWKLFRITKDGEEIDTSTLPTHPSPGRYLVPIEIEENETKKYEVFCIPIEWYAQPKALTMHLDGKLTNGFAEENAPGFTQQIVPIWKDLSHSGNDGILYNFDLSGYTVGDDSYVAAGVRSGWDKKGLRFDGRDDVVAFPGKINKSEYTVSIYFCLESNLATSFHRIISTGNDSVSGFPAMILDTNSDRLRLYGHGRDEVLGNGTNDRLYTTSGKTRGVDLVQMDYVYSQTAGTLTLYVDGKERLSRSVNNNFKSVLWTAIGGRLTDISRQLHATFYNVMIYEKALSEEDIWHNYRQNARRYGITKTGSSVILPVTPP